MSTNKKYALITGSNRGIGLSILEKLASNGFNIFAHSRLHDLDFEKKTKSIARSKSVEIIHINFDLQDTEAMRSEIKKIIKEKLPIDVLVNSAGIIHGGLFQMTPIKDIRQVFEINLFGMLELTQLVCRYMMRNNSGSIINISSVAGIDLSAGNSAYGLSKAAIIAFTKTLSAEMSSHGIRVNAIAPSLTETDMGLSKQATKEREMLSNGDDYFYRIAQPEEIANVVNFLASVESSFINGQVIRVDGGNRF